ncbi:MAG: hypothetical protein AABW64_04765 [Nanoarchaeota archaeon]
MVWFFKKKRESEISYQKEIALIHDNLKDSFLRIKQDIKIMKDWISHLNDRDNIQVQELKELQSRVEGMNEVVSYTFLSQQKETEKEVQRQKSIPEVSTVFSPPAERSFDLVEELTDTQKSMFYRAGLLLKESGQEWLALKSLASDLYPEREYDQVRSTTSEYVNVLVDNGLLDKKRRGKHTLVSLTKKGDHFFKQIPPDAVKRDEIKEVRKKQKF